MNKNLSAIFENGKLPAMVYINKQEYGRNKVMRPLHSHDSICEVLLIYKGTGTYYVKDQQYPLEEGDIIFSDQDDLHEVASEMPTEIGSFCIGIADLHINGLPENHLVKLGDSYVRHSRHLFPTFKEMCEQMFLMQGMNEQGKLASQLLCSAFIVMTTQLTSFPIAVRQNLKEDQFVIRIRNYLDLNFTDNISLDTISEALKCSSAYVSHVFKKEIGMTPIQYVIRRRIGLAQTLLISTDLPATKIATMIGYDNTNYFCTLFSKITGITPIQYRMLYLEELRGNRNQS